MNREVIEKKIARIGDYVATLESLNVNCVERMKTDDFAKIAGFRNFLAHDYEKTNYDDICQIMLGKLEEVKTYLRFAEIGLSR